MTQVGVAPILVILFSASIPMLPLIPLILMLPSPNLSFPPLIAVYRKQAYCDTSQVA